MAFRWPWELQYDAIQRRLSNLEAHANANALSLGGQTNLAGGATPRGSAGGVLAGVYPSPTLASGTTASGIITSGMLGTAVAISNINATFPRFLTGTYEGTGSATRPAIFTSDAGGGWTPTTFIVTGANAGTGGIVAGHGTWPNVSGSIIAGIHRDLQGGTEAILASSQIGPNASGVTFAVGTGAGYNVSGVIYRYSIYG